MKTTRTAQYLVMIGSASCMIEGSVTYAAAEANISCRFARVKSARIAVKIRVETSSTPIMIPVDEPSCDECVRRSRI
jgi:hypothetical protein